MIVTALAAHVGRLAETPAASAMPALGSFDPGAMGRLRSVAMDEKGRLPANIAVLGRSALASAPLAYEPFFAVAAKGFPTATATGRDRDAALLREALRRNPRSREARVFLLRYDVSHNRLGEAIDQIAALRRLDGSATGDLMQRVGAAIRNEKQIVEASAALAPHPELFEPFLSGFTSFPKSAALSIRLVGRIPRDAMADPVVKSLAMRELVNAQAFAEARGLWASSAPPGELIHSPDFADPRALLPFNWELKANATGVAEYEKGGGVSIDYYGREAGPLVSQLVTLAPGAYMLTIQYQTSGGEPGALGVKVACAGASAVLFEQALTGPIARRQVLRVNFVVPTRGCGGQFVSVGGRLQESRAPQQAFVSRVDIVRRGR